MRSNNDGLFGPYSLDEKKDPSDRFQQALDESATSGAFRSLLEKHFASSWSWEFRNIETVEEALRAARSKTELRDQIASFVQSVENHAIYFPVGRLEGLKDKFPGLHGFARESISSVFGDSPEQCHKGFKGFSSTSFEYFLVELAPKYYGQDFYLEPEFFQKTLSSKQFLSKRKEQIFKVFEYLTTDTLEWNGLHNNLLQVYFKDSSDSNEALSTEARNVQNAFQFLKVWLEVDSKILESSDSFALWTEFESYICNHRCNFKKVSAQKHTEQEPQFDPIEAGKWIDEKLFDISKELKRIWCCHVVLDDMSEQLRDVWGNCCHESFIPLMPGLEPARVEAMVQWAVCEDIKLGVTQKKRIYPGFFPFSKGKIWCFSPYKEKWKAQFQLALGAFTFEDQLQLLEHRFEVRVHFSPRFLAEGISLPQGGQEFSDPIQNFYEYFVSEDDLSWWDSLLRHLPEQENFPKNLFPRWTSVACNRFGLNSEMLQAADKALGIIRKDISEGGSKYDLGDFEVVWRCIEWVSPEKALRHRWMFLRAAPVPCSKEDLEVDKASPCPWTATEILQGLQIHKGNQKLSNTDIHEQLKENEQRQVQFLGQIRTWFAEYCLSRLKLRKGEKASEAGYKSEQVVEPSPIWRKGYLKALSELGIDLGGEIHKTIHFIGKNDPSAEVRAVAKDCYKIVRREHIQSLSSSDIRRGLIAAYWWLLLVQRQNLGAAIDEEAAVRTRRRQLRRP